VLSGRSSDSLLNLDDEEVTLNTRVKCKERLLNYGVALKDVRIESVAPVDAVVHAQIIADALGGNKDSRHDSLIEAIELAQRNGTRIPLRAVPDTPPDSAA
jgi:hypothetical protein